MLAFHTLTHAWCGVNLLLYKLLWKSSLHLTMENVEKISFSSWWFGKFSPITYFLSYYVIFYNIVIYEWQYLNLKVQFNLFQNLSIFSLSTITWPLSNIVMQNIDYQYRYVLFIFCIVNFVIFRHNKFILFLVLFLN